MSDILKLNSNKKVASGIVRALNAETKFGWCLYKIKMSKNVHHTYIEVKNQQATYSWSYLRETIETKL